MSNFFFFFMLLLILFRIHLCFYFEYLGGSMDPDVPPVYGEKLVFSGGFPGCRDTMVSFNECNGQSAFLFGGKGKNDLWEFNTLTNEWRWISGTEYDRPPRISQQDFVFDPSNQPRFVLGNRPRFYRECSVESTRLFLIDGDENDSAMAEFHYEETQWRFISFFDEFGAVPPVDKMGFYADNFYPPGRDFGWQADKLTATSSVLVFGNDLWEYDIELNQWFNNFFFIYFKNHRLRRLWTEMPSEYYAGSKKEMGRFHIDNKPDFRGEKFGFWSFWDSIYIFGGSNDIGGHKYLSDIWSWNHTRKMWAWIKGENYINFNDWDDSYFSDDYRDGNNPLGLDIYCQWTDPTTRELFFFGGYRSISCPLCSGWSFSITKNQWKLITRIAYACSWQLGYPNPERSCSEPYLIPGRTTHTCFSDSRHRGYIFGGTGWCCSCDSNYQHGDLGDMWVYRGNECTGHGVVLDDDDVCVCDNFQYTGVGCDEWECGGVSNKEPNRVCSGHGLCSDVDRCECDGDQYAVASFHGDDCEFWSCNSVDRHQKEACTLNGTCVDFDICMCEENFYSPFCQVFIPKIPCTFTSTFNSGQKDSYSILAIDYQMPISYLKQFDPTLTLPETDGGGLLYLNTTSCDLIVQPSEFNLLFGSFSSCRWSIGSDNSSTSQFQVMVNLRNVREFNGTKIQVKVVCTECNQFVDLNITHVPPRNPSVGRPAKKSYDLYFFVIGIVLFSTLCIVTLFVVMLVLIMYYRKRRKLGKASKDIVLRQTLLSRKLQDVRVDKSCFCLKYSDITFDTEMGIIGEGGSQTVILKGCLRKGDIAVAVKNFDAEEIFNSDDCFKMFQRELRIVSSLKSPYIVTYYGCCIELESELPKIGIVMAYCENGDIEKYIRSQGYELNSLFFHEKLRFALEISMGMDFVHEKQIIHSDLKPSNCLLDSHVSIKLTDFGFSKILEDITKTRTLGAGTSMFVAPEVTRGEAITKSVDLFSFGITFYCILLCNFNPYDVSLESSDDLMRIDYAVATDSKMRPSLEKLKLLELPGRIRGWVEDLLATTWSGVPEERGTFQDVIDTLTKIKQTYDKPSTAL